MIDKNNKDTDMESKPKYTADISFNEQSINKESSNNFNRLMAYVIHYIETHYPNATGTIRDNEDNRIVQSYRKTPFD